MASPIQHENVKGEKVAALPHSIKVAAKASDVKSVRQVGTDIIITLHSGQQIVLPDAALRALTDPQLTLLFEDQDVLASALLNPGSELAAVQAAPLAAPEPAVAAPAEASAPAPAAPSQAELAPPAPTAQLAQDQYLGTLDPAAAAKSDSGFALWPWLLAGGLAGAAIPGGGGNTTNNTPTTPVITNVSISGTTAGNPAGIQNHTLTAGDTVIISVTLSEVFKLSAVPAKAALSASPQPHANAASDNSGLPTLTLKIGDTLVQATCDVTGSRDNILLFKYTIQKGDNDSHGISIVGDSLSLNGCTLTNTGGTAALIVFEDVLSNVNCLVDTAAPNVVSVVMSHDTVGLDNSSQVTVTLSEAVNAFDKSNVSVQNGSLGAFTPNSDHTQWSATFTPTPGKEASGNVVKMVEIPVFTDLAGNTGTDSTSASDGYRIDTVRPTATITMADSSVAGSQTRQVSFTFSEAVTDFKATDLNVPNGTLTDPVSTDGGTNWSATFTPKANTAVAGNVITLSANSVFDVAGNANRNANGEATPSNEYSVNTITLTISGLSNASVAEETDYTSAKPSVNGGAEGVITYSLEGDDAGRFSVASDGVVHMVARNYEDPLDVGKDNSYSYTLKATDGQHNVATQAVVVTVTNVNEAPTVATPLVDQTATQNTALHYTFDLNTFADLDVPTTLSYSATLATGAALPSWLSFDGASRSFSGTPLNADVGTISVKVTASDGALTASDSFTIAVANVNDAPTGSVIITGTPTQYQMLTAHINLTDIDGLGGTFSYQWKANGFDINRATSAFYVLTQAEVGKAITVAVSYIDGHGTPESVLSDPSDPVVNINDAPGGAVTISGTATQGEILTASQNLTDIDGMGTTITYRWFADDAATNGVGNQYLLTQADVGKAITVKASYTDLLGTPESVTSSASALVAGTTPPTLTISDNQSGMVTDANRATPVLYTFAFSEDVTGFDVSRVTVNGGTKGAFTTLDGHTYTLAVTADDDSITNLSVTVNHTGVIDRWGNELAASVTDASQTADTRNPTVTTFATSNLDGTVSQADQIVNYTLGFSEAVATLTAADLTISGGDPATGVTLAADGLSATFSVTAANSSTANLSVGVASSVLDLNGNALVPVTNTLAVDTTAPHAISARMTPATIRGGGTSDVAITFSEPVHFTNSDVSVANGVLDTLVSYGDNKTWYATFTPDAGVQSGSNVLTVLPTFTDMAGNTGVGVNSLNYSIDTQAPGVQITLGNTALVLGSTSLVTFTFTEPVTGFANNDLLISNGSLTPVTKTGDGMVWTATFTPSANTSAPSNVIELYNGSVFDLVGNANSGTSVSPNFSIDTLAPTLVITSSAGALKAGETAAITFSFSEDPGASFVASDISVSGGTLGALSGSGLTRSATFTPTANLASGAASITVAGGSYDDAAGNLGGAGTTPAISIDTLAPTLAITSNVSSLKSGESASVTFSFSEDPGASFTASDIVVSSGTLGALSGTGATRTATFTPDPNQAAGTASIAVANTSYTDLAGNLGSGNTLAVDFSFDTLAPTLAITSNVPNLKAGETAVITFAFSEDPGISFIASDISTSGGTLGALSAFSHPNSSSWVCSATFTPTPNLATGAASIMVAGGNYNDAAGNPGVAGTTPSISVDTLTPTLAITSDVASLKAGESANITFTFSEDPGSSFNGTDISSSGGLLNYLGGAGLTRSATFTPTQGQASGTASITVAGSGYTDQAGNPGSAGPAPSISFDTLVPTLAITSSTSALKAGETATITFSFSEDPGTSFVAGDISTAGGTLGALSGAGLTRSATFTPDLNLASGTASITVASGNYHDPAGNSGSAGSTPAISIDTQAPHALSAYMTPATLKSGEEALVSFTFSEAVILVKNDVSVANGAIDNPVSYDDGLTWYATFTPAADVQSISNVLTVLPTFTDLAGNIGVGRQSRNYSIDTLAPTLLSIAMDSYTLGQGETATVTFTFSEAVKDFARNDLSFGNGAITDPSTSDGGTHWTAIFTPSDNTRALNNVIGLYKYSVTDLAGNSNSTTTSSANYSINTKAPDTTAPMVAYMTFTKDTLKQDQTMQVAITFSEPVLNFDNADVTVGAGTLGTFSTSNNVTWVALFTPTANFDYSSNVLTVIDQSYTDEVGLAGAGSTSAPYIVDTRRPTATIALDTDALKAGQTSTVTFAFSEIVIGFGIEDLDLTNAHGSLGSATSADGGKTYTALFTPTAGVEFASAQSVIQLKTASVTDIAGNLNSGVADSAAYAIDTKPPTLVGGLSRNPPGGDNLRQGQTATITLTFSEDPGTTFSWDKFVTSPTPSWDPNGAMFMLDPHAISSIGTLVPISDTGLIRQAIFTPFDQIAYVDALVGVNPGTYTDAAGNPGGGLLTGLRYDTLPSTLTISSDLATLNANQTATISFHFSENINGFPYSSDGYVIPNLVISGGTLGPIQRYGSSNDTYTATFTPDGNVANGTARITMPDLGYTDNFGNPGAGFDFQGVHIDTVAPTLGITSNVSALKAGETATISFSFSEALSSPLTFGDISVQGGSGTLGNDITKVSDTLYTAVFTPTANLASGVATISVAGNYHDAAGNVGAASNMASTINIDTVAPTLRISTTPYAFANGVGPSTVWFVFSEVPVGFQSSDVVLTGSASSDSILGSITATSNPKNFTASYTPPVGFASGQVTFTVAAGQFTDATGNGNTVESQFTVAVDTVAPSATISISSGDSVLQAGESATILIHFSERVYFSLSNLTGYGSYAWVGDLSNPGGDGMNYYVTIRPNAGIASGQVNLTIKPNVVADNVGQNPLLTDDIVPLAFTIDTKLPIATVTGYSGNHDYYVSLAEALAGFVVTGTGEVGASVTLENLVSPADLNHVVHTATVLGNGSWSMTFTQSDFDKFGQGGEYLNLTSTDTAGNVWNKYSETGDYQSLIVQTAAPVFTSPTTALALDPGGLGIASGLGVYDANATYQGGAVDDRVYYLPLLGTDAGLFSIGQYGVVSFNSTASYADRSDHSYHFTVQAKDDPIGNITTQDVTLTLDLPSNHSSIAVFSDPAHTQSMGSLILPVTVDGGSTFYYWDYGGAAGADAADQLTQEYLNSIFKTNSNGNLSNSLPLVIDNTYRYATLYTETGAAVQVSLPTMGALGTGTANGHENAGWPQSNTSVGNATPSNGSTANNPTYNDLLAIWDAYNGQTSNLLLAGLPTGWAGDSNYWSATTKDSGNHIAVNLGSVAGASLRIVSDVDSTLHYVALQVL